MSVAGSNLLTYVIKQADTLEGIAQEQLGDWMRWREVAALNNLRFPFVSDRPDRWFGPESTAGILDVTLPPDSSLVRLPGERKELIPPRSLLFLDGYSHNAAGNNSYTYDTLSILDYNEVTGTVLLEQGLSTSREWPEGTRYRIFPPPADLTAHVARPGERILLPIASSDGGNVLDRNAATSLYGTDIYLSHDGKISMVNGDLAVVTGFDNIGQALRFRAELPYGGYIVHNDEGNRCFYLIGEPVRTETAERASSFVKDALGTDPRVASVNNVIATVSYPDTIEIEAEVQLSSSQETISLNAVLRNKQ